jgi:tetratricopeptide (TPR) repeat protein
MFDGQRFTWYRGSPSPLALVDTLGATLPKPDTLDATPPFVVAEATSREAAVQYLERRKVLRTAEALLSPGPDSDASRASAMLDEYLARWPNHLNALIMAANAASEAGVAMQRWEQALALEPQNARLHAGAAAILMQRGDRETAASHLQLALVAPLGTHDAEDANGRALLEKMLRVARG